MNRSRALIVDLACVIALIALCLAIGLPRYRAGMNWADEGFLACGAVRVIDGQVPNRDFVSLQPPLSFYVVAAAFKLFGTSLLTLRALGLSIFLFIPLLLYAFARPLMTPAFAVAAALPAAILGLPYFNFVPFAVWQGIAATLAAGVFYLRALTNNRGAFAFVAGVLTAASIFLRHDQGTYFVIALCVLTLVLRFVEDAPISPVDVKRMFVLWLKGTAITAWAFLIYLFARGALPEMFRQLVVFPFQTYGKTSSAPFPRFSGALSASQNTTILLYYLPPALIVFALAFGLWRIIRGGFRFADTLLAFLLVWAALFYFQVLTRSDLEHLLITLPPIFLLGAYAFHLLRQNLYAWPILKLSITAVVAALTLSVLWLARPVAWPTLNKATERLSLPRGGVRVENGAWLTDFVRGVQQYVPPDRPILALPYQPMFYFLCERRNPTRWNYLWPGDQTARDHEALIDQVKKDPPAAVFITGENDMAVYAPAILDYVHAEYRHAGSFDVLAVYFPRDATP
jgi:hypothetical protein